jgi:MoaA/NifB/PqqE/SkfB family radical SAM enzyme
MSDRIIELGFRAVTICGGEPTVVPGIGDIIDRMREAALGIIFYTNGILVENILSLLGKVNILGLSLESVTSQGDLGRSECALKGTLALLDLLGKSKPPNLKIKVGTVVHRYNVDLLDELADLILSSKCVDLWRLYQFSPAERGRQHQDYYLISDEVFKETKDRLRRRVGDRVSISFRSRADNIGYCIIMNPWGDFFLYKEAYQPLGVNIFSACLEEITAKYDLAKQYEGKSWLPSSGSGE